MYDRLTKKDIEKMEKEIEHRKLVVRKEALEDVKEAEPMGISAKILNTKRRRNLKMKMKAGSAIWRK